MAWFCLEQGERQTDLVVQISTGQMNRHGATQTGRHHLTGGCLAYAAGDRQDASGQGLSIAGGSGLQSQ